MIFGTNLSTLNIGLMICGDPSGQEILYLRALQGHSGRNLIHPSLQDNVLLPNDFFEYVYHVGCAINLHSIINSGLILGGQNLSKRQTVFFLAVNPLNKEHKDPYEIDLTEKVSNWECLYVHREKGLFLSVYVDGIKLAGKKHNLVPMWKVLNKEVDLGEPTSFLDHVYLGCTQRQCEISKDIVDNYRIMFESRISAGATEKLPCSENLRISSWSNDMEGHTKKCVERYCELANKTTQQLYKVSTPCIDDHHFTEEEMKSVGELSQVCSQIVLKCFFLARIGRPDILWSVNKLARSITKWTTACDKRLIRLISYIHHTCEYKQYCHVGNTAKQCRLGLFQDSDFARDLEDSKSTSGGTLCVFGSHTFVPISWMCKKQTSVSHSSESEIISLDARLRLDGIPVLDLWDLIVAVLHGNTHQRNQERGDPCTNQREVRSTPHNIQKRKQSQGVINDLDHVDFIPSNVKSSHQEALVYVFEHNEAVIKMILKGRSPDKETCFQNQQSCSY